MKRALIILSLLPLAACTQDNDAKEQQQTSEVNAAHQKNPFVAATEERLQELDADVTRLKYAVARQTAEASEELEPLLAALEEKRQNAADKLSALKDSTEDAWDSASDEASELLDDLERSLAEAWDEIEV